MDLRFIESFLKITEVGNFTKAAKEIGYAQSTITWQMQQLEDEMGAPLFDRIGKNCVLTPLGEQLVPYAVEMLHLRHTMLNLADNMDHSACSIRIGSLETLVPFHVMPIIAELRSLYPNITITIKTDNVVDAIIDMLHSNVVDIALIISKRIPEYKNCVCVCAQEEQGVYFTTKTNLLSQQTQVTAQELFAQPFVLTGDDTFMQKELVQIATINGQTLKADAYSNSGQVIFDLVNHNHCVSFLSKKFVHSALKHYDFVILETDFPEFTFYSSIQYHKHKNITPQMRTVLTLLENRLKHT